MRFSLIFILASFFLSACSYNELPLCDNENPSYKECIKPIFSEHCVSCHNQQQSEILILENYNQISGAVNSGHVIDRISRDKSDPLFMPLGSPKLTTSQIQLIINWKANGALNN